MLDIVFRITLISHYYCFDMIWLFIELEQIHEEESKKNPLNKKGTRSIFIQKVIILLLYTFPCSVALWTKCLRVLTGRFSIFRSKRKAQKSDTESLDILIPDKMKDASDVGCETISEKKQLVDNEDDMFAQAESKTLEVALDSSLTPVHSQHCQNEGS